MPVHVRCPGPVGDCAWLQICSTTSKGSDAGMWSTKCAQMCHFCCLHCKEVLFTQAGWQLLY